MKAIIQTVVREFVDAGVLKEEHSGDLEIYMEGSPDVGSTYADCVSATTKDIIRLKLHQCVESTQTRQALRDLFIQNPKEYQMISSGNDKLTGFFVGRAMKILGRNYDPKKVGLRLAEMIAEDKMKWWFEC